MLLSLSQRIKSFPVQWISSIPWILLCFLCNLQKVYADEISQFKSSVISNCLEAHELLTKVPEQKKKDILQYLSLIVKLGLDSIYENNAVLPSLPSQLQLNDLTHKGQFGAAPYAPISKEKLLATFTADDVRSARECSLDLIQKIGSVSLFAIPTLIETVIDESIPVDQIPLKKKLVLTIDALASNYTGEYPGDEFFETLFNFYGTSFEIYSLNVFTELERWSYAFFEKKLFLPQYSPENVYDAADEKDLQTLQQISALQRIKKLIELVEKVDKNSTFREEIGIKLILDPDQAHFNKGYLLLKSLPALKQESATKLLQMFTNFENQKREKILELLNTYKLNTELIVLENNYEDELLNTVLLKDFIIVPEQSSILKYIAVKNKKLLQSNLIAALPKLITQVHSSTDSERYASALYSLVIDLHARQKFEIPDAIAFHSHEYIQTRFTGASYVAMLNDDMLFDTLKKAITVSSKYIQDIEPQEKERFINKKITHQKIIAGLEAVLNKIGVFIKPHEQVKNISFEQYAKLSQLMTAALEGIHSTSAGISLQKRELLNTLLNIVFSEYTAGIPVTPLFEEVLTKYQSRVMKYIVGNFALSTYPIKSRMFSTLLNFDINDAAVFEFIFSNFEALPFEDKNTLLPKINDLFRKSAIKKTKDLLKRKYLKAPSLLLASINYTVQREVAKIKLNAAEQEVLRTFFLEPSSFAECREKYTLFQDLLPLLLLPLDDVSIQENSKFNIVLLKRALFCADGDFPSTPLIEDLFATYIEKQPSFRDDILAYLSKKSDVLQGAAPFTDDAIKINLSLSRSKDILILFLKTVHDDHALKLLLKNNVQNSLEYRDEMQGSLRIVPVLKALTEHTAKPLKDYELKDILHEVTVHDFSDEAKNQALLLLSIGDEHSPYEKAFSVVKKGIVTSQYSWAKESLQYLHDTAMLKSMVLELLRFEDDQIKLKAISLVRDTKINDSEVVSALIQCLQMHLNDLHLKALLALLEIKPEIPEVVSALQYELLSTRANLFFKEDFNEQAKAVFTSLFNETKSIVIKRGIERIYISNEKR
jgi:hypothetical protein